VSPLSSITPGLIPGCAATLRIVSAAPLIAIVGPTGCGKSDLALRICEELGGEVVNCDSLQIYRYFDIGTAKTPPSERRGIPHHMLDIVNPDETFTAGDYSRIARPLLASISRSALPVVTGGTGFYLRALLDGLFPAPSRSGEVRERLAAREGRRPGSLHRLLRRFDTAASRAIHANDTPKLIRALEVYLLTRQPITTWYAQGRDALTGFCALKIGLAPPRAALYGRLNTRCRRMFEDGLVEEVKRIREMGWPESSKPFESHGYRQVLQMLRGEMTADQALLEAQRNTRHYAKRQITWFRREPGVEWLAGFGDEPQMQLAAIDRVRRHVKSGSSLP
jgi:tRNA dimethylallyltransferase